MGSDAKHEAGNDRLANEERDITGGKIIDRCNACRDHKMQDDTEDSGVPATVTGSLAAEQTRRNALPNPLKSSTAVNPKIEDGIKKIEHADRQPAKNYRMKSARAP